MTDAPYNLNDLKGAMDWYSSQLMKDCGGIVATRHFPKHVEFIARKGNTVINSTIRQNASYSNPFPLETFEHTYLRGGPLNPNSVTVTNRLKYL